MRRIASIRVLTLVLFFVHEAGVLPASGQGESVDLLWKASAGDVHQYATSITVHTTVDIVGNRRQSETRAEGREVHRVLDVAPDGTIKVEVVLEDLRMTNEGRTEESLDAPVVRRVRPDGRVVEPSPGESEDYPIPLPGRRVTVGESWTRQVRSVEGGARAQGTVTYTLAGVDRTTGTEIARIRVQIRGNITAAPVLPPAPGLQSSNRGTVRGAGEFQWAIGQGRLLRTAMDSTIEALSEISGERGAVQLKITQRLISEHRLIPPEAAVQGPLAPEFFITPAKGIGTFTLDLPVSEMTAKLGRPASALPAEDSRAGRLTWRNPAIVLYVDPSDTNKVIGIAIGDRKYRTDKSVGFGSSEGAVLLAYGRPQITAEVKIPNVGGIRYLIYDDLGIAFGITGDQEHAARGPSHAPLGAVDIVIVFSPGGAAKILPMP